MYQIAHRSVQCQANWFMLLEAIEGGIEILERFLWWNSTLMFSKYKHTKWKDWTKIDPPEMPSLLIGHPYISCLVWTHPLKENVFRNSGWKLKPRPCSLWSLSASDLQEVTKVWAVKNQPKTADKGCWRLHFEPLKSYGFLSITLPETNIAPENDGFQ